MMGRTPDYLNRAVMAFGAAADYFAADDPRFGENVERYYGHDASDDLCLTHTLINPQANRGVGPASRPIRSWRRGIVEESDGGIVIRGARMLATLARSPTRSWSSPRPCSRTGRRTRLTRSRSRSRATRRG